MKKHLSLCVMLNFLIVGSGCAQTYNSGRYYQTTYTTVPRVYTTQSVVTYHPPAYQYQTSCAKMSHHFRQTTVRVDEISRQVNRQVAEIESQVRRRIEEIELSVHRQTEEIERQIARQMSETRREMERSPWQSEPMVTMGPNNGENCGFTGNENKGKSCLNAVMAKLKDGWTASTSFLQTVPWWVWVIGVVLFCMVMFLPSIRNTYGRPFRARNDNPWVIDPASR